VQPEGFLYVDGASLGNPGEGGCGVVLRDREGRLLGFLAFYLGRVTNNQAEYRALIRGLEEARRLGWRSVKVYTDSELLARQIQGAYKVRDVELKGLFDQALSLLSSFEAWVVEYLPREENGEADRLAKKAAQRKVL